ncbi:MAG: DUF3540 domain-containing protein [Gammaproteobacteria bacterium]|nr:DUF3540 domain-containing protein [Gammaproteobacteria bacterium]MBU1443694.1 DUF3540 domain-containing protein [Gammaproteobacteria bacterium]MBU2407541.1 DUF3540 domain-containing protein [Gammaproteobacteria bacterium]
MSTRDDRLLQLCAAPMQALGTVLAVDAEGGGCLVDVGANDIGAFDIGTSDPTAADAGTPDSRTGGAATADAARGALRARRAASCLLDPAPGDRVWLVGDLAQGLYVTAILERAAAAADAAPPRMSLPPGTLIDAGAGAMTLRADALRFEAASQLSVQADSAAIVARKLSGVGREAVWSFGHIKVIGELIESFAERVVQFARWSQRTVEGIDQLRSAHVDYRATHTMQLQAENLVANAENLVKVDGEQIHMG